MRKLTGLAALTALCLAVTGCPGGDSDSGGATPDPPSNDAAANETKTFTIAPGDNATQDALAAFIAAKPGDTIEFECGFFEFSTGLVMQNTEGVTIRGCGRNKTVLSFVDSDTAEGLYINNVRGVTVEDLTVADTPGDGIKIKGSDIVTYRNVRTMWSSANNQVAADNYQDAVQYACPASRNAPPTYQPDSDNGRYGIYPVQASNVLLDNVESLGASDAGIYVGQSDDIIIKNSHALYNVAGFEFENTQRADMHDNVAECNTVGFIVYDLPFLTQYGTQARMFDNTARNNNFDNFASGGIVSQVPSGSGLITLAYDNVEVFDNHFEDQKTGNIIISSYALIGDDGDLRQDIYTEGLNIHDNTFVNGGYNPAPFDLDNVVNGDQSSLLPTLIRLKNGLVGAQILYDGLHDGPHTDCPYPTDANGERLPADEHGKPIFEGSDAQPECRYNAYKFDADGERKMPEAFICIENNHYRSDNSLVPPFANFHGLRGLEPALNQIPPGQQTLTLDFVNQLIAQLPQLAADRRKSRYNCSKQFGSTLAQLPAVELASYSPPENGGGRPSDEEVAELCNRDTGGAINREALARVDCPNLADYHLFENPEDPSTAANGNGTPYNLNTKLFSDYAVKFRFVFLPPGKKAVYHDGDEGPNAVIGFPVGTVISKTFSFPDDSAGTINHVETRLLIKREDADGTAHWVGRPYIWETAEDGSRTAKLSLGGGTAEVSWHYTDANSGVLHDGATDSYSIPHANQCISCHANTHRPPGPAPIGPKPRNLNKPYDYASGKQNQIAYWVDHGMLADAPADLGVDGNTLIAKNLPRLPHFNVPGDSGFESGSDQDVEARVRAYLDVNCAHCHNPGGTASNTGLYLDALRDVDNTFGICKTPTAAGAGSGGRPHDIQPSNANQSIMPFRIGSEDIEAKMPPIAHSVVHEEAHALVRQWINNVVDNSYDGAGCSGGGGGGLF